MRRHFRFPIGFSFFAAIALFIGTLYILRQSPTFACDIRKEQVDATVASSQECTMDADCTLLKATCDPYVGCGLAVRADRMSAVMTEVQAYAQACPSPAGNECATCAAMDVRCENTRCIATEKK